MAFSGRLFSVAIVFVGLACAQAQEGPRPGFGRGPGRGGFPSPGLTTLDTNHDGTLDANEIDAASASLAKLDKNADGQITADEIQPTFSEGRRGPEFEGRDRRGPDFEGRGRRERDGEGGSDNVVEENVKALMAFDTNGDGKLSKAELPERMQGIFDRADENKDGFLTADEIRKFATAQSSSENSGGPPRGGRDMNFIRMDPVFAAIDTNHDGVLSADEIRNAAKAIRTLDLDGDGKITREEIMTAMRQRREAEPRDRDKRP